MALQHLRSSTANKRANPASMADGQLALNTNNGSPGLFFKDSNGDLVKVGPVHVGTTAPNVSPASGGTAGNSIGEQWLDTSSSKYVFKIWDGTAWRSEAGEFVDAAGDVMTGALGIIAGTAAAPGLYISGDTNTGLYSLGADQLALSTGGTGRLFVDSGGRVMVGVSTALTNAYSISTALTPAVQVEGNTANAAALSITRHTSAAANLLLQRGVTGTPVVADDPVGQINFNGFDGTNYFNAALVRSIVDGTPGTGSMPGRLSFQTTPSGSTTPIERLRIGASGLHSINTQAHSGGALGATTPAKLYLGTGTYTDTATAASGTVTHGAVSSFDNPAIAASNTAVTYTSVSTVYIDGAPTAGTNVTITNPYALYVNAGQSSVPLGSAASPSLVFGTDTNTGIYSTGADTVAISTGGTQAVTWNAAGDMTLPGTGATKLQAGTSAQRPGTAATGMVRFNSTITQFEGYNGSAWTSIGGGATGGGADRVFVENDQTVTTNYTIATGRNAMTAGPVTVNSGVTVTVPSNSSWVIV